MSRNKKRPITPYVTKIPPDGHYNVWCPYCDWRLPDSMVARKRMGQHIADNHPEDVRFPLGKEPDDFEPERIKK